MEILCQLKRCMHSKIKEIQNKSMIWDGRPMPSQKVNAFQNQTNAKYLSFEMEAPCRVKG
jgi:hypothetical protein